ncbi:MAG: hypothetical protein AB1469_02300 [Pseudomonadota bacterium]
MKFTVRAKAAARARCLVQHVKYFIGKGLWLNTETGEQERRAADLALHEMTNFPVNTHRRIANLRRLLSARLFITYSICAAIMHISMILKLYRALFMPIYKKQFK